MKLVNVLQWVTDRDSSGGSPTRPKPAGGSVGNPACVGSNLGCGARGNEEIGRTLSPEICIVVDTRITLELRPRGKADALHVAEGSNPRSLAAVQRGYHRGLRTRHVSTGGTWELGRSNTLLKASRPNGSRGISFPGSAEGKSLPLPRAKKRATERYRKARQHAEAQGMECWKSWVFARICGWNKVSNVPSTAYGRRYSRVRQFKREGCGTAAPAGDCGRPAESAPAFGRSRCPPRRPPTATLGNRPPSAGRGRFPTGAWKTARPWRVADRFSTVPQPRRRRAIDSARNPEATAYGLATVRR